MLARQHVKTVNDTAASIAEVLALLRTAGERRYDGEPVSHREHALQCATLALNQGQPAPLVAACLLHDVGHLLATSGAPDTPTLIGLDDRHEVRGPAWLAPLFPPEVLHPIRWHVDAKRFLAATDPAFLHALSADSRRSLALQGGPMERRREPASWHARMPKTPCACAVWTTWPSSLACRRARWRRWPSCCNAACAAATAPS